MPARPDTNAPARTHTDPSLYDLSFDDLEALIAGWGEPAFRARQIWE